jgi:CubicO group peptidase (beta-lactamase class C family)
MNARAATVAVGILVAVVAWPARSPGDEAVVGEIEEYLGRLEKLGFAGALVVAQGGEPLVAGGYGLADRERGMRWTPSIVSTVGSITKQFTGAAILALQEDGRLSVDDPITDYFDDVPEDKRQITLHQLLTHTSGIVDVDGAGDWDPILREEFVRLAMGQELAYAPGEGYDYSNAGYSLLGAIIEQVTGTSYEEYVRQRLFLPAGMFETGYILARWGEGRMAQGYREGETWGTVLGRPLADDGPYWALRANGGIHSTAFDMLRWGQALLTGRPLSAESMSAYWSPHADEGGGDSFYGYGWVVMDADGTRVITHNGGNGILFADMLIVPEAELVLVVQTNVIADFRLTQQLLEILGRRLLLGEALPSVPDWDERPAAELAGFAGTYLLPSGGALEVGALDGELTVVATDASAFAKLLSLRPVDEARAKRLSTRIDEIASAYLAGDFEPLWEAYGRFMSLEGFAERSGGRLRALQDEHGELRGHEVLGTAFRDGRDVTLVRLDFENGQAYRAYVWDPDEDESLLGSSVRGLDHVVHVLPDVDGGFATWDARTGTSREVEFQETGEGLRLRIGEVEAVRRR